MRDREVKKKYTTYLFSSHLSALEKIARISNKSITQVISEALDTYLLEVGALDKQKTIPPTKGAVAERMKKEASDG